MSARRTLLMAALSSLLVLGCAPRNKEAERAAMPGQPVSPPSTQMATLTGTLRGGMMAIGGETTGWTLAGDGAVGGVELDVANVNDEAKRLDGKRVTVTGKWVDKDYVERGRVRQLKVESIAEAR